MKDLYSSAIRRIRPGLALRLLVGDTLLAILSGAWLQIPDSHAWQFVFAMLSALALLLAFLWLHAATLRDIHGSSVKLWVSMLTLAPWPVLWWKASEAIAQLSGNASQRAGYWNSKLSPHLRNTFTYERLSAWQLDVIGIILWFVVPAILLPLLIETITQSPKSHSWLRGLKTLTLWEHWITLLVLSAAGYWLTAWIVGWHPAASAWVEVFHLVVRLLLTAALDTFLILLLIAVESELLHRWNVAADDPALDGV